MGLILGLSILDCLVFSGLLIRKTIRAASKFRRKILTMVIESRYETPSQTHFQSIYSATYVNRSLFVTNWEDATTV